MMSTRGSFQRSDYTIGWVCPLPIEQRAALMVLDEQHERLRTPQGDGNIYHLGSIDKHNIVLVSPPRTGNSPTTSVVSHMKRTFTGLKHFLLVGIGGGVPVVTDSGPIRLGHVVVGIPIDKQPGVVQYDHGKLRANGDFVRTGVLGLPSTTLLQASNALQAGRGKPPEMKDPIKETVESITQFPGLDHDHLYHPEYLHRREGEPCSGGTNPCDPKQRIKRPTVGDASSIVVHKGTIASGEVVLKDAIQRDKVAQREKVLCFEMEATGALADSECLVIRGISDYCDSHKNDVWQQYAAATAAAYARQLVSFLPRHEPKGLEQERSSSHGEFQDRIDQDFRYYPLVLCCMLDKGMSLCRESNQLSTGSKQGKRDKAVADCLHSSNRAAHREIPKAATGKGEKDLCSVLQAAIADLQNTYKGLKSGREPDKELLEKLEEQLRMYLSTLMPRILQVTSPDDPFLNERMEDGFEKKSAKVGAVRSRLNNRSANLLPGDEDEMAMSFGQCVLSYDKMVVESLNLDISHHREDDILDSESQTLKWLLEDPGAASEGVTPHNNVRLFLRSELNPDQVGAKPPKSIFYINGKAGSGKSTLMKKLCKSNEVGKDLEIWAGKGHVLMSRFYFWYRGSDLQRSLRGMLRALLYQCLRKQRFLIPLTVPQDAELDTPTKAREYWSLNNLKRAFNRMLTHEGVKMNLKFCFFIDGLDEYATETEADYANGVHVGICQLLMEMARHPHVKMCVSSRPEPPFESFFQSCPGFKLQERTTEDIRNYVKTQLRGVKTPKGVQRVEIENALVGNANGVFLWVVLATRSVLEAINEHASPDRWMKILDQLPRGLENFYMHMLTKADEDNWTEGLGYLLLVNAANGSIPLQQLAYTAACDATSKGCFESATPFEAILETRIQVCCKGLLEISFNKDVRHVSFLHKSVPDFLGSPSLAGLRADREVNWVAEHKLLDGYMFMLKSLWPITHDACNDSDIIPQISHNVWVDKVKPIVKAYMSTAQRALRLNKPADTQKLEEMYEEADNRWMGVKNKKDAEMIGLLHWSMASHQNVDSEDLRGRIKEIRNFEEFIEHWQLDNTPSEEKRGGLLGTESRGDLIPATMFAGQNADQLCCFTKKAATAGKQPATNSETAGPQANSSSRTAKEKNSHAPEYAASISLEPRKKSKSKRRPVDHGRGNENIEPSDMKTNIGSAPKKSSDSVSPSPPLQGFLLQIPMDKRQEAQEANKEIITERQTETPMRSDLDTKGKANAQKNITSVPQEFSELSSSSSMEDEREERRRKPRELRMNERVEKPGISDPDTVGDQGKKEGTNQRRQRGKSVRLNPDTGTGSREVEVSSLQDRPVSRHPTPRSHKVRGGGHEPTHDTPREATDRSLSPEKRKQRSRTSHHQNKKGSAEVVRRDKSDSRRRQTHVMDGQGNAKRLHGSESRGVWSRVRRRVGRFIDRLYDDRRR